MTICPCCGFKFEGAMSNGCTACGARSVGEPLPKPERELPSFARSLLLVSAGSLLVLTLLTETLIALFQRNSSSLGFWTVMAAGQTAAWRLKWIAIPIAILVLWGGRKLYRSVLNSPERFCGLRHARAGYLASSAFPVLIAALIIMTIPERLRHRQFATEAGNDAVARTLDRAIFEYKLKYEKLPSEPSDLRKLPDPDGSIAAALDSPMLYKPTADVAARQQPQRLRGAVIRNASLAPADEVPQGLSFTNYEITLAGPDKIIGNEDDLTLRDGVITKAPENTTNTAATRP